MVQELGEPGGEVRVPGDLDDTGEELEELHEEVKDLEEHGLGTG